MSVLSVNIRILTVFVHSQVVFLVRYTENNAPLSLIFSEFLIWHIFYSGFDTPFICHYVNFEEKNSIADGTN